MIFVGPRTKELTTDEETVEVLEIIENCESFSDLDEEYDPIYVGEYQFTPFIFIRMGSIELIFLCGKINKKTTEVCQNRQFLR